MPADVGIDVDSAIDFLIVEFSKLSPGPGILDLVVKLRLAGLALDTGQIRGGVDLLSRFNGGVEALRHAGRISPEKADALVAQIGPDHRLRVVR